MARLPTPGIAKNTSTMIEPPIRVPKLMPNTVSSEKEDGRSAWRNRMWRVVRPFERAMSTKSSWSVAIRSLRRRRVYTAVRPGDEHQHAAGRPS